MCIMIMISRIVEAMSRSRIDVIACLLSRSKAGKFGPCQAFSS